MSLSAAFPRKVKISRLQKTLFYLFAATSLLRPLYFSAFLVGFGDGKPAFDLPVLWSPQTAVFCDRTQLQPIFMCLNYEDGRRRCMEKTNFIRNEVPEPYYIGGLLVAHSLEFLLLWPQHIPNWPASKRFMDYACGPGVTSVQVSPNSELLDQRNPGGEVYAFRCDDPR